MGIKDVNVASLSDDQVQLIQKYEQEFKSKFGNNVVLIAFNDNK